MTSRLNTLGFWSAALFATAVIATGCASGDGEDGGDGDGDASTGGTAPGDGDGDTSTGGTAPGDGDGDTSTGGSAPGPTSVCDDKSFPPESEAVSDLEDGSVGWDTYLATATDLDAGAVLLAPASGDFEDPVELVDVVDGAPDSTQALHFEGTGFATYGAGLNFNLEGCKDLSEYEGVKFWIMGKSAPGATQDKPPGVEPNSINFRVITAGSHKIIMVDGENVGGDCDDTKIGHKCFFPPQKEIDLPAEGTWEQITVPFSELKTPPGANPGSALTDTNAMLLGWHSNQADFDIYIDDVEFY